MGLEESMRENNLRSGARFVLSIFIIAGILGALISAVSLLVFPLPEKLPLYDFFSGPIGFFPARAFLQAALIGDLALSAISFLFRSFISKPQQLFVTCDSREVVTFLFFVNFLPKSSYHLTKKLGGVQLK